MKITTFLIFTFFLFCSCENSNPQLTTKEMEWKIFNRTVDTNDPNYPLEIIEDGYKMIRAFREEGEKIKDVEIHTNDKVEWGWRYTVKNKSNKSLKVGVTYILKDIDYFNITSDYESVYINPGEIITIRSTSYMDFQNVTRVFYSGWTVEYF